MSERDRIAQAMLATPLEQNPALPPESWNRGVRNVTTGVLSELAAIPQKAYGAAQQYTDTGEYNAEPVMGAAASLMTGGMPMAAKGAAGIFGGRLGMTANHPQLMRAEDMAAAKVAPRQIWNETGWTKRADRQFRDEISDQAARFDRVTLNKMAGTDRAPLGEVLHHPKLYEAYPELKNLSFGYGDPKLPQGALGYFKPEGFEGGILRQKAGLPLKYSPAELVVGAGQTPKAEIDTVLHELQHVIQSKEGFAKGGAPPSTVQLGTPAFDIYREMRKTLDPDKLQGVTPEKFRKLVSGNSETAPPSQEYLDKLVGRLSDPKFRNHAAEYYAKQLAYTRLLGESEARLATARGTMSDAQRRRTFPALDVPEKKQIIRMRD